MRNQTRRKLLRMVLALCTLACVLSFAPVASPSVVGMLGVGARAESAATREGRLRVFDEVWEQVRERYFDPSMHGVDWQEARRALRPLVSLATQLHSFRSPH